MAENLFGQDYAGSLSWERILSFLILCAVIGFLLVLRRPDAVMNAQFWAEDGRVFFHDAFYHEASLFTPARSYIHFVPRLIAIFANPFPVIYIPLIYNCFAILLASICTAWFSLPHFRHIIGSDTLRVVACVLISLIPAAGTVLMNITNCQWYLFIWCTLACFQPFSGIKSKIVMLCVYLMFLLSQIITLILFPLWVIRAIAVPKDRKISIVFAAAHIIYALCAVVFLRATSESSGEFHILNFLPATVKFIVTRVGLMSLLGAGFVETHIPHNRHTIILAGLFLLIPAIVVILRGRDQPGFMIHTAAFLFLTVASVAAFPIFRNRQPPETMYFDVSGARYFFLGITLFYIWVLDVVGKFRFDSLVRYGALGVLILMVFAATNNIFNVQKFEDTEWPMWAEGFEQVRNTGSKFPFDVPVNPRPWLIPGSGRLPPETVSIVLAKPSVINEMEWTVSGWRSTGSDSYLSFSLEKPTYVYLAQFRYSLAGNGLNKSGAVITWRADPSGDFNRGSKIIRLPTLPETGGNEVDQQAIIADRVVEFRIKVAGNSSEIKFSQIILQVSPSKIR